jgi:L-threonylcarbamoyladenylate synthase
LGGLDILKIQKTLGFKMNISTNPKRKIAPGQSHLHYSPGIPLRMNVTKPKNDEAFIIIKRKKTKHKNYFYLTSKNNLDEAAKNLYSCLRKIKNEGYKSIAVEKIPNIGLGKAINDRLRRASKY